MTTSTVKAPIEAGVWNIDPTHSTVGFVVKHLMVSKVRGKFESFSGTITVAEDGTPSVQAEIDVTTITTGNPQRDGHIKSADFFDADQFPKATFVSTSVRPDGDNFVLTGDFTLHGVTKPLKLSIDSFKCIMHPMFKKEDCGADAFGEFNRGDFGISKYADGDAGKVKLRIQVEAIKN